jgi:hypothetical protein
MNNVMETEFKELTVTLVLEEMHIHKTYPRLKKEQSYYWICHSLNIYKLVGVSLLTR